MDRRLLPVGKHYGLNIRRDIVPGEGAGKFTGGGHKLLWHTTEGGNVQSVINTLRLKGAVVHFVIDPRTGEVAQLLPLDVAGEGLKHVFPQETNRANVIQVEIVGFAKFAALIPVEHLAALAVLIEHRFGVPRQIATGARSFLNPVKLTPNGFVMAQGHLGHVHTPGNDHTDPGRTFRGSALRKRMSKFDPTPNG